MSLIPIQQFVGIRNPLDANLDCDGFDIDGAGTIRTGDLELTALTNNTEPYVLGYSAITNAVSYFATPSGGGGTLTGVGNGSNISVDNTVPNVPVVSLANPLTSAVDAGTQNITNATTVEGQFLEAKQYAVLGSPTFPARLDMRVDAVSGSGDIWFRTGTGAPYAEIKYSDTTKLLNIKCLETVAVESAGTGDVIVSSTGSGDAKILSTGDISIQASGQVDIQSSGNVVSLEGLLFSGTTVSVPTADADLVVNMTGSGSVQINNTSAVGGADPIFSLTNTNNVGTTVNPVKMLMYKNDANTTSSDVLGDITVRANGGAGTQVPFDYTSIKSVARGTATSGNIDGSLLLQVAENAPTNPTPITYIDLNGGNANIDVRKPITNTVGTLNITGGTAQNVNTTVSGGGNLELNATGIVSDIRITSGDVVDIRAFETTIGTILQGQTYPGTYSGNLNIGQTDTKLQKPLNTQNQAINTTVGNITIQNAVPKSGTGAGNITIQTTGAGDLTLRTSGGGNTGDVFIQSSDFMNIEANGSIQVEAGIGAPGTGNFTVQNTPPSGVVNNVFEANGTNGRTFVRSAPDQAITLEGNTLTLNGASMTVGSSGSASGQHLQVQINGINYVIELRNP